MCCHPRLRFCEPQVTSATRVESITKANLAKFFDIFEPVLRLINYSPHRLFNYEETVLKYFNIKLYPHHSQLFLLNHLFEIEIYEMGMILGTFPLTQVRVQWRERVLYIR